MKAYVRTAYWLATFLRKDEREAVLGDLAEEGVGPASVGFSIAGLLVRRELAKWRSSKAWFVLLCLLLPCVLFLSVVARDVTDGSAIYLWLFGSNSDLELLRQPGYWSSFLECLPRVLVPCLALLSWSWCSGYAIGSASRSTRKSSALLMCALIGLAFFNCLPRGLHTVISDQARAFPGNRAVFSNAFYGDVFPRLALFFLVLCPALRGIRDGASFTKMPFAARLTCPLVLGIGLLSLAVQALYPGPRLAPLFPFAFVSVAAYAIYATGFQPHSYKLIDSGAFR